MKKKTPDELDRIQRQNSDFVTTRIVFPLKGHAATFYRKQPPIRDCNSMRVAGQILQDLLRAAERWFSENNPFAPSRLAAQSFEGGWIRQAGPLSEEGQFAGLEGFPEISEKQLPEPAAQYT